MKIKHYKRVINSGIRWLSDVPVHWQLGKVKNMASLTPRKPRLSTLGDKKCSFLPMEKLKLGVIKLDEERPISEVYDGYTYFTTGDVLIAKVTPCFENKNMALAQGLTNGIGFGSSEIYVLRPKSSSTARYLLYRLQEDEFMRIATSEMTGAGGLKRVPSDFLLNFKVAIPPTQEQQKIAQFLDYETAKIDALIDEQKRLIELLKEKRQAVISHAVTKGLNPNAPMKDSGVEWLGDVPEHWEVVKLKHVKSISKNAFVDGPFGSNLKSSHFIDDGYAFVIESNFATTGHLDTSSLKQISESHFKTIERSSCSEGDIIIAKIGARYGMSSVLPAISKPSVVSGNSLKLTIDQRFCSIEFANYVLTHLRERGAIEDIVNMTAQPALSLTEMNNLPFPLPRKEEQERIVKSLSEVLQGLEQLASTSQKLTALFKERRSALISAAVTGKIDVRDWQPPEDADLIDSNAAVQMERQDG
ncbi:restriction endonuclease subunit S [Salinivibrio sp. VYel1]|uniref:restriction endonuclease subunit S n=1 Tax=Salinivibrio sp. VYel1 TaxID=2490490 RepID=UPI00128C7E8A|nr:restriction endonuclease subunit S [Salinivibrio sp. VYel1]MPX91661.1 restriction endonuclease subunit S [Salinivibrio sp. VYel1]